MPSVLENQLRWTGHSWEREGHEWSPGQTAAGGEMLWWRGLLPRIVSHLPASAILEIGPGFGRWTRHLLQHSVTLTAVDLTERCVEHCRARFASHSGFSAWTNDGESLDMIPDESIDFVFSFDSLVHAEAPVLRSYLRQLARKLAPGGAGFIHHSNLQALATDEDRIPSWVTRTNWRSQSMSARLFRELCAEEELHCRSQEIINWIGRSGRADRHHVAAAGIPLTDVLSTFERPLTMPRAPTRVYLNPGFADEWRQIIVLAALYGRCEVDAESSAQHASLPLVSRVAHVLATTGLRGALDRLRQRSTASAEFARSYLRDHLAAWRVARNEPILNQLRRHCCPDCRRTLTPSRECHHCRTQYVL